ncbi:MAG: chromosome segregation ATPase [Xenococcaceae cyanobacterium MO_188.B19]|nr:chromosome segregation ATPase [Xenococcaceae cyanobacterium MO_188.B19]
MATNRNSPNFSSQAKDTNSNNLNQKKSLQSLDGIEENSLKTKESVLNQKIGQEVGLATDTSLQVTASVPWWQAWQLWGIILVFASGGIGYGATSTLLKLPETESCSKVHWPVASASVRLYCAQVLAEQNDVNNLLKAIALLEKLPENHPLRREINRNIEKWSTKILTIGEEQFQAGDLESAITIAQQIPENLKAHNLVAAKIQKWEDIWQESSDNYAQVEARLRASKWNEAFSWAVRLADSKNHYWATTKYQETIDKINVAQEESAVLDEAVVRLNDGKIDGLLEAVNRARKISQDSYAYQEAQNIVEQATGKLLTKIETLVDQQEWSLALQTINRIPAGLGLQEKLADWNTLAGAGVSASLGTVLSVEDAIAEAEEIEPSSPLYGKAQYLISRWKLEIEDIKHLARARELARDRNISAYNSAIIEARLIPTSNPRYREAQREITRWQKEIYTIEDRPVIERARSLAVPSNVDAWRRAIAEINLVSSKSPLYGEARRYARSWQNSIEREEDQPILDEAITFANFGDYNKAISTAQKILGGRALSAQAQTKIDLWQKEIQARKYLKEAYALANQRTPDSLVRAILIARQVPSNTSAYNEVVQNVNLWSEQILAIARRTSFDSFETAIDIAQKIPSGTSGHYSAQSQIKAWKQQLEPPVLLEKKSKKPSIFESN